MNAVCMCVQAKAGSVLNPLGTGIIGCCGHTMWELGTELEYSGKVESTVTC